MYYEDSFHPNVDDNSSIISDDTCYTMGTKTNSIKNNNKKAIDDAKRADKDYCCHYIKNDNKKVRIEYYNSGVNIGSRIRNSVTGERTQHRIGSSDELFYFKVRNVSVPTKTPITLFYDSPEQYERIHKCTLLQSVKEKWYERNSKFNMYPYSPSHNNVTEKISNTIIH